MIDNGEVFPNLDPEMTNRFLDKLFLPTIEEMLIFIMTVIGDIFITIVTFSTSAVALFGYCFYIAYRKRHKENETRLLNYLTSVLAINDISTTITSMATIVYNYNQEGRFWLFGKIIRIYSDSKVNTSTASDMSMNFPSKYLVISLMCKVFLTMMLHFLHLLLVKHHHQQGRLQWRDHPAQVLGQ